jgi:hypothetical protein
MSSDDEDDYIDEWQESEDEDKDEDEDEDEHQDENEETNSIDLRPEIGVLDRINFTGSSGLFGKAPTSRVEQSTQDPLERFRRKVDAISRYLNNWEEIENIDETSINTMLIKASKLDSVQYKNPNAYVLGFLATGGGKVLSKERFTYVIKKVLPRVDSDSSVLPPDIIRYAILWQKLN